MGKLGLRSEFKNDSHRVDYKLKAGETARSPYFDLSEPLCLDYDILTNFSKLYSRTAQVIEFK